jgi:hypothetical protein
MLLQAKAFFEKPLVHFGQDFHEIGETAIALYPSPLLAMLPKASGSIPCRECRFSLRMLWKSKALTITVLLTVALGIGANTAIFTVDYAALLAPMPYPQPDQLVMVW